MPEDKVRKLRCLVEGDDTAFKIIAPVDADIDRLKNLIWEACNKTVLRDTDAVNLVLWKLIKPEPISPSDGCLAERIASLGDLSKCAIELREPHHEVLRQFPEHPRAKHIHVIVQVPPAEGALVNSFSFHGKFSIPRRFLEA